ncbi:SgcJ/EcaC family oxidoreductase [Plastoroseomonas hellenica]|uniref:SgcJ/EcaC family oxidoreductase n=1 Tax=Plastoroseomonas hellenica TaxID=2687306 RepID=UPI001BA4F784|nr:SgcJ/EcaC family oxidoreductase [Plastoroseomonas hellenica]MBR0647479.1 SgcJ/EcaC family oxidoreductase [Plastoroseomonas hellenica]
MQFRSFALAMILLAAAATFPRTATAADPSADPAAALRAWAEAYATNDGTRSAAVYTEGARLWGSVSREQTIGREAIAGYFGRARPGATAIGVSFGEHAVRVLADGVAVASGHYTFSRRRADGTEDLEPSRFSMVLVRGQDGIWRIADHHSSRLPPAPR